MSSLLPQLKLLPLHLLAALMATYRTGPARREPDRNAWAQQRIALLKLDGIGDFILATGFLRTVQQAWPRASITLFCRQPIGDLARQQFPGWSIVEIPQKRGAVREIWQDKTTRHRLQSQPPFDLLIDLRTYRDFLDEVVTSWIPAHYKLACQNPYRHQQSWARWPDDQRIYDRLLEIPPGCDLRVAQDIQCYQLLARWLFPQTPALENAQPRLTLNPAAETHVANILANQFQLAARQPFLLVCPGTSSPIKEYPIQALAEAIQTVATRHSLPVLITGSRSDERTTKPLYALLKNQCRVIDVSGQFNLIQHPALVSLARAVISMDTCHAHFAGALGTPAVVILGGGQFGLFAPWGESPTYRWLTHSLPCFGCHWACTQDHIKCIQDIPAAAIVKALTEVLAASPERNPNNTGAV
jgi:ADP-heptose:LPS heptosyltransferase